MSARTPPTRLSRAAELEIVAGLREVDPPDEHVRALLGLLAEEWPVLTRRDIVWLTTYAIQRACYAPTLPAAAHAALGRQAEIVMWKSVLRVVAAAPNALRGAGLLPRVIVPPLVVVPPPHAATLPASAARHAVRVLVADFSNWMSGLHRLVSAALSSSPSTGARDGALYDLAFALIDATRLMEEGSWRASAREALTSLRGRPGAEHLGEQDVLDHIGHLIETGCDAVWRGARGELMPDWRRARDTLGVPRERRKAGSKRKKRTVSLDRPAQRSRSDRKTLLDVIAAVHVAGSDRSVLDALAAAEATRESDDVRATLGAVLEARVADARPGSARWHLLRNARALASGSLTLTDLADAVGIAKATLSEAWRKERAALSRDPRLRALVA